LLKAKSRTSTLAQKALAEIELLPGATLLTSALSRLECRVLPLRQQNPALVRMYDLYFSSPRLEVIDISDEVIDVATSLRAHHGLPVPDALHLATAKVANADFMLTADKRLQRQTAVDIRLIGG